MYDLKKELLDNVRWGDFPGQQPEPDNPETLREAAQRLGWGVDPEDEDPDQETGMPNWFPRKHPDTQEVLSPEQRAKWLSDLIESWQGPAEKLDQYLQRDEDRRQQDQEAQRARSQVRVLPSRQKNMLRTPAKPEMRLLRRASQEKDWAEPSSPSPTPPSESSLPANELRKRRLLAILLALHHIKSEATALPQNLPTPEQL